MTSLHIEVVYIYKFLFFVGLYAASLHPSHRESVNFTFNSIMEVALPVIHPIVAAGSNKCESVKSFFGLTYEQLLEKNSTDFHDVLNIDLITKNGNVKYNLSATKRLNRLTKNADSIVVLIHGFMESSDGLMVQEVAPEYLKKTGLKILALDGSRIINLDYFRSTSYVRFMGDKLGSLLSEIVKNGQDPARMTLVGHSLGAHIAGIAGKRFYRLTKQRIGRIIALDPAGPCFSTIEVAGKLDRADAAYVDVIHTNAGILGLKEPVGHKDFYPNGGMTQPGCILSTCDHSRAWQFLSESVNKPNAFPARKCENWTMYRNGLCSKNEVSHMGINSEAGAPGTYFLTTRSSSPFGLGSTGSG